jgi:tetratricopeptide (TPR) repeat protein/TolB-like protein
VEVRTELERVLSHALFCNSIRLCSFLRYIVEETIAGRAASIKEYTIGDRVYRRGAEYNPKADAIVRVEAGRLRGKLKKYYAGPGSGDQIRIDLPSGAYVPVFTARSAKEGEDTVVSPARQRGGNMPVQSGTSPRFFRRWAPAFMLAALVALAAWRLPRRSASVFTVVVLPIANLTGSASQDVFAEGLTDQVAAQLSDGAGIRVERAGFAGGSAAAFEGRGSPANAGILNGSLQSGDGEIRLVIHVDDGKGVQVWSKTLYSGRLTPSQFADLAASLIARSLDRRFGGRPLDAFPEPLPRSQGAAELFARSQHEWETQTHEGITNSFRLARQAVQHDPGYAAAWSQRGAAALFLAYLEDSHIDDWYAEARMSLEKALELNDRNAEAHIRLGNLYLEHDWKFSLAERELRLGVELNPGESASTRWYALAAEMRGNSDAARRELQYALALNPRSEVLLAEMARLELEAGRNADAEEYARAAIVAKPAYSPAHFVLALIREAQGDQTKARSEFQACGVTAGWPFDCAASLTRLDGGGKGRLDQFKRHYSRALLQIAAGQTDAALNEVREGLRGREPLLEYVCMDPQFRSLFGASRPCAAVQRWIQGEPD